MRLRLIFSIIILCSIDSAFAQCPEIPISVSEIDTFCTGTRYSFGDTLIRNAGMYTNSFIDVNGCDSIVNLDLRETPNVTFFIDIDTIAPQCLGDSLGGFIINVENAVEPIEYALFEGFFSFNQITVPLENPQSSNVFADLSFGQYTVVIVDRFGCAGLSRINLRLQSLKGPTIIDTLCSGSTYRLGHQLISDPGIYFDTLMGAQGCDSVITIDLRVEELDNFIDFNVQAIPPGCMLDSLGSIEILTIEGDAPPFQSFLNDELITNFAAGLEEGVYEVLVQDRYNCQAIQEIQLVRPNSVFELSINDIEPVDLGGTVNVNIQTNSDISQFMWNRIPSEECVDCLVFSFRPTESFDYMLTAINVDGCVASDTLSVTVLEGESYFVPDAIRPNSSNEANRVFSVFANPFAVEAVTDLFIFDRYGNQMYRSSQLMLNDISTAWDGKYDDQFVEQGIYTYRATIHLIGGKREVIVGSFLVLY